MTETPGVKHYDLEDRTLAFAKEARNYVKNYVKQQETSKMENNW